MIYLAECVGLQPVDDLLQLCGIIGLGTDQVGPEPQCLRFVNLFVIVAPEHDPWAGGLIPQALQHLHPITARHLKIQEHEFGIGEEPSITKSADSSQVGHGVNPVFNDANYLYGGDAPKLRA